MSSLPCRVIPVSILYNAKRTSLGKNAVGSVLSYLGIELYRQSLLTCTQRDKLYAKSQNNNPKQLL